MALADLRALAARYRAGTPGTPGIAARCSGEAAPKTPGSRAFARAGTRRTPGTPEGGKDGEIASTVSAKHAATDPGEDLVIAAPAEAPDFFGERDAADDREAVVADAWPEGEPPRHPPVPDGLVERLARAETALPWQCATSSAGLDYLRANARLRLGRLDPLARGLLVGAAEARRACLLNRCDL